MSGASELMGKAFELEHGSLALTSFEAIDTNQAAIFGYFPFSYKCS
jgi:hypothetical protein